MVLNISNSRGLFSGKRPSWYREENQSLTKFNQLINYLQNSKLSNLSPSELSEAIENVRDDTRLIMEATAIPISGQLRKAVILAIGDFQCG